MSYNHARHSLPEDFLAVCKQAGVEEGVILAHLDSDEFYAAVDDRSAHTALANQLILTQKHKTIDVFGVLAIYDVSPERLYKLLEAGVTHENVRRYAGRNLTPEALEKTYRHSIDLGVLDGLIESTKMPFENMAILLANHLPADWLGKNAVIPGRHRPNAPYRVFCEWAWQTENSDLPEEYLEEMFLGSL